MKYIRKFTGLIIFLVITLMAIVFFRDPEREDMDMLPDRIEYYLDEDWVMTSPGSEEQIKVDLPYSGIIQASDTIIFQNTLPEENFNMAVRFSAENAYVRILLDGEILYQQELEDVRADSEYYCNIPNGVQDEIGRAHV